MAQQTRQTLWQKVINTGKGSTDERSRILQVANSLVLHLHPASVPATALKFRYTWGLGGISAILMVMLGLTGVMLMFRYDARIQYSYLAIQQLETEVIFGSLIRAVHHWSANLLVITSFLHLLRVFFTGSYKHGRTANWIIGISLFILSLALNFTGYLLPWDQLSYWAITVSTSLVAYVPLVGEGIKTFFLGGPQVGQAALSNFYAMHVVFFPAIMAALLGYHFWKVRKDGGISQPLPKEDEPVKRLTTIPHLVNIELAAALVVFTGVMIFSMFQRAPLGQIANPITSPNPAKAAWYFLGLQELLLHMHPLSALGLVALAVIALVSVPWIDRDARDIGVYFRSKVGKKAALFGGLLGLNLTPILVVLDEYWIDLPGWFSGLHVLVSTALIPFLVTVLFFGLVYFGLRRSQLAKGVQTYHSEALLGVFIFAITALIMLTVIGIFFRGANMALVLFY
jgi:quinol-cytochrome oxidoreductase complex cytochrome b subunit